MRKTTKNTAVLIIKDGRYSLYRNGTTYSVTDTIKSGLSMENAFELFSRLTLKQMLIENNTIEKETI